MPTTLTTPEVRLAVTTATVDAWSIELSRESDLSVNPGASILTARVTLRDALGREIDQHTFRRDVSSLPAALKTQLRDTHVAMISALRAAGVLPAGTDTADL
jgi:hypothetical protein